MGASSLVFGIAKMLLGTIYAPMKLRPRQHKITILSRQSDEPSGDIALLSDYLREHHPDVKLEVLCCQMEKAGLIRYGFHMLRQMWHISNSSVALIDSYCIPVSLLHQRKELKVIQMWHALAAIKKFGYQSLDKPDGRTRKQADGLNMHRNYDYVIAPGEDMGSFFCEAFDTDPEKLVLLGLPRIDRILHPVQASPTLREQYRIPADRELLLYAPTFRRNAEPRLRELIDSIDGEKYVLLVRLHPLFDQQTEGISNEKGSPLVIIDRKHSSEEWLTECDRIITDYSAFALEAALTGKPVYFYVYDIEEYRTRTGLNIDPLREIPQAAAVTGEELAELLDRPYDYEAMDCFCRKYISVDLNNCTEKLGEFIYGISKKAF